MSGSPIMAADTYMFGVLPRYSPVQMYRMLLPLASYLHEKTGVSLQVKPYPSYDSFLSGMNKGKTEISFEDSVVSLKLVPVMEPLAVAVGKDHGFWLRGMIVVPRKSKSMHLRDLRGKKVAMVSSLSAGGFVSQAITFADIGLNPFTCLESYQTVKNSQENVLLDVAMGNAAAGFVEEETGKRLIKKLSLENSLRIMGYTAWVPRWTISVRSDLSKQVKIDILNALLTLTEEDRALKILGIKGFVPAYKVDFENLSGKVKQLEVLRRER